METVVAVPLPPPTQAELDELRMQSVERAAATSSHFNQMTYDELAQFHAQRSAMAQHLEEERPLDMAAAMEKNRQEQEESRAALSRQQEELVRQLEEMKRPMAEQSRLSEAHHDMLRQASDAMLQQHYKVEELNQKVRRDSESWGLFAEETSQRSAFTTGRAAEAPRLENLMGVQQVPYKGSTKRERREFMDEYLAYSRRVERASIVPRVCAHDCGKSFDDITENDWRDYILSARAVQELDLDAATKTMASLNMDTKIRDAESRVGRLLADFYEKLEQLDVPHLPEQEPKQSVKILTAAIQPHQLKSTVERQLARETNKAYKLDVHSAKMFGEKARRFVPTKKRDRDASVKTQSTTAAASSRGNGCLKCGSDEHRVFKCPKVQPGEAQLLLDQRFKEPHGASSAASEKRDDAKCKINGTAVDPQDALVIDCPRTVACDVNGVTALALLDSGADQSLTVDREVKLRLTFDTTEGTLVLSNLKCWLAAMPLKDGLGGVIVSRDVMARLGYCPQLLSAQTRQCAECVVETMNKPTSSPEEVSLYPEEERAWCGDDFVTQLPMLFVRYEDVFRLTLGAEPVRGAVLSYPHSKWCSAPLIVKKPDANDFRVTVDVRPINAQTERILWPMPMLEVILDHLAGAEVFFTLDFFKGYWQFALDKTSQEMFLFLTDTGDYTPTRVLMGGTDSVAYCQSSVQEMFASELYNSLLVWLVDLLGYEKSKQDLLVALERVLVICQERGLKRRALERARRFGLVQGSAQPTRWCGRIVSSAGVKHDPERIKALKELKMPKVAKVLLAEVGWNADHAACLDQCKEALNRVVTLAHPKQDRLICVSPDASDLHWGGVVIQIPRAANWTVKTTSR
ncbi:hypothetical protein H310_11375 [Aphanomyces invadans]|uniref:Reverse transcriptase domain-containing protein n=1 Tax=Aphanomyces invadans TaxID=157072 RepID=A0A024TP09_9STRA|nr:hypothetical protein H310_11375 [Aphanomyces invadans]ETV95092.1 hypothetical protein H310_11375 [Aphanomyces invadans]|eukprot:XP_008876265.1 hypothetical protein H310_11375 [Aphanomyces invadans]